MSSKIPAYWQNHLSNKICKIHRDQISCGRNGSSFALITDVHWDCNAHNSAALMEKVLFDCSIPYFFNAGDTVSGKGLCEKEDLIKDFVQYRESFSAIEDKCIAVLGNHDMSFSTFEAPAYYAEQMTAEEIYEYIFRPQALYPNRFFGEDGSYYYVDNPSEKMRYVVLNTHDVPSEELGEDGKPLYNKFRVFSVLQRQLDWFAHVALDVPDDEWSVVLCSHENPCSSEHPDCTPVIIQIINAFKRHEKLQTKLSFPDAKAYLNVDVSVDYTGRGGNFIAWLCGHIHRDEHVVVDGVTCISTLNDSMGGQDGNNVPHVVGTDTEHSFDVFTVDKKRRIIHVTRVGLGQDREFSY